MPPRLLAWFAAGLLLFNFPLLSLWDSEATLWGLPVFPLVTLLIWGALIAGLAWLVEGDDGPGAGGSEP